MAVRASMVGSVNHRTLNRRSSRTDRTSLHSWVLDETAAEIALILVGFLVSRATLAGGLYPFAPAYMLAVARCGSIRRTAYAILAVWAGIASAVPFPLIPQEVLLTLALAILGHRKGLRAEKDTVTVLLAYPLLFIIRLIGMYTADGNFDGLGGVALEGILMMCFAYIFTIGMRFWLRFHNSLPLKSEDAFPAVIIGCSAVLGLSGIGIFGVTLDGILARLLVMIGAYAGGPGIGASLGVATGLVSLISGDSLLGAYSLTGLLGGTFKHFGKAGVFVGSLLACFIASMEMASSLEVVVALAETVTAAAVLVLIPQRWFSVGAGLIPGTQEHLVREDMRERRLRELVSKRLKDFSRIFNELAHTFHQGSPVEGVEAKSIGGFLENIVRRSCLQCSGYRACWHDKLYKSYVMMLDVLALAESNGRVSIVDLPEGLRNKCIQPQALVNAVNGAVEVYTSENLWEKRLKESREIVSSQLTGVSRIMNGLANEIKLDLPYQEELESVIKDELGKKDILVDDVLVIDRGDGRLDVSVELPTCGGECACANSVAPIVSKVLGRDVSVWNAKCALGTKESACSFELVPNRNFDVVSEVVKVPKTGSVVSGDASAVIDLPGGKIALILSDGMGVGPRAALESGATINMLKQLMDAGFEREFAIRTINSILMLRSPEDTFSTLDMAIIDLHSGNTEFLKIGSAPSYLKRGKDVRTIKSTSVPVGILNTIEVQSCKIPLKSGDILVMVTDGAVDAFKRSDKDEWIASALRSVDVSNPKEIADLLYSMVKREGGKQTADDVTILVARVLKHPQQPKVPVDEASIQTLNTGHYAC